MVPTRYSKEFANMYDNVELEILDGYDHEFSQNMPAVADIVTKFIVNSDVVKGRLEDDKALSVWEQIRSWFYRILSLVK